jgi:hypothetical protein|tara:strand:- start:602 stop:1234 length:633 start_codon:yes stop_codon:yes gene_type:complete
MTLHIEPELNVPVLDDNPFADLTVSIGSAANTALFLAEHGLDIEPTKEDKDIAAALAVAYADDPEKTSKKASPKKIAALRPASLIMTDNILTEFGQSVVDSATQIRHLVTNKLLLETENSDAKIRIRALELLGKVSDVGLFAEKSEVTITHQSSDDLRAKLRGKLEKLVRPIEDIVDAVVIESDEHTIQEDILDISSEFGSDDPTQYDDD